MPTATGSPELLESRAMDMKCFQTSHDPHQLPSQDQRSRKIWECKIEHEEPCAHGRVEKPQDVHRAWQEADPEALCLVDPRKVES